MTPPLPNLRYEKKFLVEGSTLAEILSRVRRHPSVFREAYPSRIVNNLYLDSPTRRDYHDHVNGVAHRTKTRVRWYGEQVGSAERPLLERKLRRGSVSGKEAYALPAFSINGGRLRSVLNAAFETDTVPPILQSWLRHVEPALFNRYQRHYFLSHDGTFRLTLDSALQFAPVTHIHRQAAPLTTLILELKFGSASAPHADFVSNALPFRVVRFSKYVAGIECL